MQLSALPATARLVQAARLLGDFEKAIVDEDAALAQTRRSHSPCDRELRGALLGISHTASRTSADAGLICAVRCHQK